MKILIGAVAAALIASPSFAKEHTPQRLAAATETLTAIMNAGDKGIPQDLLNKAQCVVVVPSVKAGGFIFGAEYGRGFFSCRRANGRGWSAPGAVKISGGKFGLLVGAKETDVIMLVMNQSGMEHLLSDHFQLGGEASAAAGPVGRTASAMTDAEMHAEILTYSRSRGIFGGLDLSGDAVTTDKDAIHDLYGQDMTNKDVLNSANLKTPAEARPFVRTLNRESGRK